MLILKSLSFRLLCSKRSFQTSAAAAAAAVKDVASSPTQAGSKTPKRVPLSFIFDKRYDVLRGRKPSKFNKPDAEQRAALQRLTVPERQRRNLLKENIHAKILASPCRLCAYTRTRKPNALMIPLSLCPNPNNKDEDWIMPDFERSVPGRHVYITNSRRILEALGERQAWKRLQMGVDDQGRLQQRKIVWRPDMVQHVERELERCKPLVQTLLD